MTFVSDLPSAFIRIVISDKARQTYGAASSIGGNISAPYVRLQAYGDSLDPIRANTLLTLDGRLTHQFEKAMGMLIKLQDRRVNSPSALELPPPSTRVFGTLWGNASD